jgi:predicted phage tail protein
MSHDALPPWPLVRGAGFGGNGCFASGTMVSTPSGRRPIETLSVGDSVLAFDQRGKIVQSAVAAVHRHEDEMVHRYEIWGGGELFATPNHWVLNQFGAFAEIGSLVILEDMLVDEIGHLRPIVQSTPTCRQPVYNLTVADWHTFIANGIRVHNGGLGSGILGSGGGGAQKPAGGAGRSPIVADDTLNSTQYARVLLLLGEGEQEGFPSARRYRKGSKAYETACLKDIFINGTPILKATANPEKPKDSDYNYKGIEIAHTDGTPWQTFLGGFSPIESTKAVGLTVTAANPITRTVRDDSVDAVRVTLQWPSLQQVYKKGRKLPGNVMKQAYQGGEKPMEGDMVGTSVKYEIQVASAGGSFKKALGKSVDGRTGDAYQRSHEVPIRGPFPVDVRVVRVSPDSNKEQVQDLMIWQDYTEITYAKLVYPYSALLGVQVDAKYFNSWPQISSRRRGVKVPIPDNATVDDKTGRLIYSGIWTGAFGPMQWTTDPSWLLHEVISNCRWGFGQHCQAKDLDKWSFYKASQYCSELVPDGRGGWEPRFACSVNLQNATDAFELINQLASVFRAMAYWGEGLITMVQDAPGDPLLTICNADCTPAGFRYSGANLQQKHTVVIVKYFDNEKQDFDYEPVEDPRAVDLFGAIAVNIDAFACTSRGQARRAGEWLLYTEQYESDVVVCETILNVGAELRPGHLFNVCDLLKTGARRGGKVLSAPSASQITIDQDQLGISLEFETLLSAKLVNGVHEVRRIASISGNEIELEEPFSAAPLVGGTWAINSNQIKPQQFRCISVEEKDRTNYLVTGVRHLPSKYDYIERNIDLNPEVFAPLKAEPLPAPSRVSAAISRNTATGNSDLNISWPSVPGAAQYEVAVRKKL